MRKYIIITLIALISSSTTYASFPVSNINQTESTVTIESPVKKPIWEETPLANLSLILGLLWFPATIAAIIFAFDGPEELSATFFIIALASFIGAIITGIRSLIKEEGGRWKAIIGLATTLGLVLLSLFGAILEGLDEFTY